MCKAISYAQDMLDKYTNVASNIEKDIQNLWSQIKICDLKIVDILHVIENSNFNAYEGYMLCKQLQNIRSERRTYKNEISTLTNLKSSITKDVITRLKVSSNNVKNHYLFLSKLADEKIYKPRYYRSADIKTIINM